MTVSRAWEWEKETSPVWLEPSEESYYLCNDCYKEGLSHESKHYFILGSLQ